MQTKCSLLFLLAAAAKVRAQVELGTAQAFAVLGSSTITNTGSSVIQGDVGLWPGTSVTGFPPGTVVGGTIYAADDVSQQAHADARTAYDEAAAQSSGLDLTGDDLGDMVLVGGVYTFSAGAGLTGPLTLDGQGNNDSVWIFQIGEALTTASASAVVLANSALACNVFWQVASSATLGGGTSFVGSILAGASITLVSEARVEGGLYALGGAVTLDTNDVSVPSGCAVFPLPSSSSSSTATASSPTPSSSTVSSALSPSAYPPSSSATFSSVSSSAPTSSPSSSGTASSTSLASSSSPVSSSPASSSSPAYSPSPPPSSSSIHPSSSIYSSSYLISSSLSYSLSSLSSSSSLSDSSTLLSAIPITASPSSTSLQTSTLLTTPTAALFSANGSVSATSSLWRNLTTTLLSSSTRPVSVPYSTNGTASASGTGTGTGVRQPTTTLSTSPESAAAAASSAATTITKMTVVTFTVTCNTAPTTIGTYSQTFVVETPCTTVLTATVVTVTVVCVTPQTTTAKTTSCPSQTCTAVLAASTATRPANPEGGTPAAKTSAAATSTASGLLLTVTAAAAPYSTGPGGSAAVALFLLSILMSMF